MGILARELRIGNLVRDDMFYYSVCEIGNVIQGEVIDVHNHKKARIEDYYEGGQTYSLNYENINPIPLTEEWLLKFGFRHEDYYNSAKRWVSNSPILLFQGNGYYTLCHYALTRIKYVHQLQNLYFVLTGNELEIIEKP